MVKDQDAAFDERLGAARPSRERGQKQVAHHSLQFTPGCYHGILRIGIHTSIAGSLENAALKAAELGANTFQIFSSSPRMWRASVPGPHEVRLLREARERFDLTPLVIHVNYLVNLASPGPGDPGPVDRGVSGELERAETIGAEYLVVHPGNYKGQPVEQAIAAFALGLKDAAEAARAANVTVLLENTAGCGRADRLPLRGAEGHPRTTPWS